MSEKVYNRTEDEIVYRVQMKQVLRQHGCEFDGSETTEHLEEMMQMIDAPKVKQFDGVVKRAQEEL